eukprot:5902852-Lingulodinium_polyedra.AAC.1
MVSGAAFCLRPRVLAASMGGPARPFPHPLLPRRADAPLDFEHVGGPAHAACRYLWDVSLCL